MICSIFLAHFYMRGWEVYICLAWTSFLLMVKCSLRSGCGVLNARASYGHIYWWDHGSVGQRHLLMQSLTSCFSASIEYRIEQIASNFIYLLQHGDFLNEICFWTFSLLFISNFTTYKGRLICQFHEAQVMDRCYLFTFKSYPTSFEDGPLSRWNEIWTLWFVRMSVLITTTLEYSLVNTKVRLSVYKLRRLDQISLRRWRRNMIMYHDFSRTHVQTHSGQRVLKSPRRFIESAVALCFNSPKYLRKWRRQLRLHHNHPRKFWERLHWLIGTFPFYTRYLFEKVS